MIRLESVSKYYRNNQNVNLGLHKVSLEFHIGEFVAITGESGSGKSTLLNVISGSDSYEDGELYYKGKETSYYDEGDWERYRKENIGFVYQNYNLIESFSVLENVKLAMQIIHPDIPEKDADEKAMQYLKKVGLENQAKKRAAQLSSGQKQRLAIARAIAKETDIIVADEPTGNLDVENSRQIIQLLKELSEDRLVLIVTHDYGEVEPYITRKIRMYEGEVQEDYVRDEADVPKEKQADIPGPENSLSDRERRRKERREEWKFAGKISMKLIKAKPYRFCLLLMFYVAVFVAIYILYGSFDKSIDYSTAKEHLDRTFVNGEQTRISVKRQDGKGISAEDVETLQTLAHVEFVDQYDVVNDISYMIYPEEDYIMEYRTNFHGGTQQPLKDTARAVLDDKFLKSATGLTQQDIVQGTMPEKYNEIVIHSADTSIVGKDIKVYIRRKYNWGGYMACMTFTITGLTELGDTHQIYISDALAENLNLAAEPSDEDVFFGIFARAGYGVVEEDEEIILPEMDADELYIKKNVAKLEIISPVFIINPELEDYQVRLSANFYADATQGKQQAIDKTAYFFSGDVNHRQSYTCDVQWEQSQHGNNVIEVSELFFEEIYPDRNTYQASVYVEDYAYLDRVIREIHSAGYEAVSSFRAGCEDYDSEKVAEQTTRMLISLAALAVVFVTGILVIRLMINGRTKDYQIMQLLGLGRSVIDKINVWDILCNMILATGITIVAVITMACMEIPYISSAVRYYEGKDYVIYILIIAVMMFLLHKSIKKVKRKTLHERR